jgi:AraC-like DNA-binding protein
MIECAGYKQADAVVDRVLAAAGVARHELHSKSRHRDVVVARTAIAYALHERVGLSYPESAPYCGYANHSSAATAVKLARGATATAVAVRDLLARVGYPVPASELAGGDAVRSDGTRTDGARLTLEQAAARLGVSRDTVQREERAVLQRLREVLLGVPEVRDWLHERGGEAETETEGVRGG